ncbi:hypothetical protein MG290_03080 [Flavobacterium sp. CBA20B-1]|uniref:hypothetical protein n=1 Tax=unclassified Flavobacterium TaxID=196869 RepID=UPI0022249FFD|nr:MULTISPECIES: hypothetical protein [unclassified Flavobacterium]WCM42676.1 hypothetical protein MG290_03080 [Flavobacterium sp. CBA20B-1]
MKKLLFILALFVSTAAFGQQKKSVNEKSVPAPLPEQFPELKDLPANEEKRCFNFQSEEQIENWIYITNTILEYDIPGSEVTMNVITSDYDIVRKKKAERQGDLIAPNVTVQIINGKYEIEKNTLAFRPNKSDKFDALIFKLVYNANTQKLDHLIDEKNNKFTSAECIDTRGVSY